MTETDVIDTDESQKFVIHFLSLRYALRVRVRGVGVDDSQKPVEIGGESHDS